MPFETLTPEADPLGAYFGSNPAASLPPLSSFSSAPSPSSALPSIPSFGGAPAAGAGGGAAGLLGGLTGMLSAIPSVSTSVSSHSGDASAGLDSGFNYQGAFQVGGSGKQTQQAALQSDQGNKTLIYVVVAAIALIVVARQFRKK